MTGKMIIYQRQKRKNIIDRYVKVMNLENGGNRMPVGRPITATPMFVEDCRVVSINDLPKPIDPNGEMVTITRGCETCGHVERTYISMVQTRQGLRYVCRCGAAVVKLYQPQGFYDWQCRACHGLVYRDQYKKLSAPTRLRQNRELQQLAAFEMLHKLRLC